MEQLSHAQLSHIHKIVLSQIRISPFRHIQSEKMKSTKHRISLATFQETEEEIDEKEDDPLSSLNQTTGTLETNKLINMRQEYVELTSLLNKTMKGEGNTSVLLVGKHGSGKSSLLAFAINQLKLKFGTGAFLTIYLNGKLLPTDVHAM